MGAAPFLFLSIRADYDAAADEYAAVQRFGGLADGRVERIRLTHDALPEIDLDEWSGIILGGGPFNVSDPADEKSATQVRVEAELLPLIGTLVERDFPFLGCCYGVGTLGTVVGATVDRTYSEPVGALTVTLTSDGRADPVFADLPDTFDAYGGHKESASDLPASVVALASSAACPVQAFRAGRNVYATQFHPELDLAGLATRIDAYKHLGYFEPETAESLKAAAERHDVTPVHTVLRRFVERYS